MAEKETRLHELEFRQLQAVIGDEEVRARVQELPANRSVSRAVAPTHGFRKARRHPRRSHNAAMIAMQAGYAEAYNVLEGFEGDKDAAGHRNTKGGWRAADLPWTQHLSEVWRMRNEEERTASLALRDGGPESVRKAIDWYRDHDRLRCGDQIAMATDAIPAVNST